MSAALMLDTNAVSAMIRGDEAGLDDLLAGEAHCISVVTEAELQFGVERRPEHLRLARAVRDYLRTAEVLPWTSDTARVYATTRTALERKGRALSALDLMIATHALATRCTLVTADRSFGAVPGLRVLDWRDPGAGH